MNHAELTFMSDHGFRFFPLLPPEIRREIYILATPTRVVHVEEDGYDTDAWRNRFREFKETCRTTLIQFKLHPDIAYFAHTWIPLISQPSHLPAQRSLESYGFTSTKKPYQPWVPTEETPEIPLAWLADNHAVAWAMTRSASLSSPAPIPAFLHVCSESREMLRRYGYQLSFGTRTHEPRTWFHFKRDTLYLECASSNIYPAFGGRQWSVGLFRPMDLLRVTKLAIKDGFWTIGHSAADVSTLLRLLPNVRDLYLVEWSPAYITSNWDDWSDTQSVCPNESYVCVPVDESDIIPTHSTYNLHDSRLYRILKAFKKEGLRDPVLGQQTFLEYMADRLEQDLRNEQQIILSGIRNGTMRQWNVPHVCIVYMCSPKEADDIFSMRRRLWSQFVDAGKRLMRACLRKLYTDKERSNTPPAYQDVGEAFLRAHEPDEYECLEFYRAHHAKFDHQYWRGFSLPATNKEFWWLTQAIVFPPRFDIL
ncbi:hypothetical protein F4804DRAFT_232366 [Jackrogersella minutella]|nr:hypothetical protein F4804DRAFT_232366 [Jackrogersella minutella]